MTNELIPFKRRAARVVSHNLVLIVAAAALVVVGLLIGLPVVSSASPGFFSRYHGLAKDYESLQTSAHKDLACADCHDAGNAAVVRDLGVAGDFYASLVGRPAMPVFTKFATPTNAKCLACHRTDWSDESTRTSKVPHPAHLRVATETRQCVKCHKWTAHEETYMAKHKTMPFSGVCVAYGCHVGTKKTSECANCHHSLAKGGDWKATHPKVVQTAGANGCLESCHEIAQCRQCHTTGKQPEVAGVKVQAGLQQIQTEHVKLDWVDRHGALARKDTSQCMKCHVSDGECRACHAQRPAFHGSQQTWIGTHKDVAKNNEQRCTTACHEKPFCDDCHKQFKEMR